MGNESIPGDTDGDGELSVAEQIALALANNTTTGDGGDGGDGGTTSSSSSAAPKVDPIVARRVSMYQSVYQSIWGEPATEGYLKAAANQGLNVWEFAYQERSKPAFFGSKIYNDKADGWVGLLKSLGV